MSPRRSRRFSTQAVEDVAHRRGAAFDREQVERAGRRPVVAHRLGEIAPDDLLGVDEHAIGLGVVVADDRVGQLVDEGVGVEAQLRHAVVDAAAQERRRRAVAPRPPGTRRSRSAMPSTRRHAAEVRLVPDALAIRPAPNCPSRKNASRGVVATQFGLPRPAFRNLWVAALPCVQVLGVAESARPSAETGSALRVQVWSWASGPESSSRGATAARLCEKASGVRRHSTCARCADRRRHDVVSSSSAVAIARAPRMPRRGARDTSTVARTPARMVSSKRSSSSLQRVSPRGPMTRVTVAAMGVWALTAERRERPADPAG